MVAISTASERCSCMWGSDVCKRVCLRCVLVWVCMHVRRAVCVSVCLPVCLCEYVCMWGSDVCKRVCLLVCACVCLCEYVCMWEEWCVWVCACLCACVSMCACERVCVSWCVFKCILVWGYNAHYCTMHMWFSTWVRHRSQQELWVPLSTISLFWWRDSNKQQKSIKVAHNSYPLTHGIPSLVFLISTIRSHIIRTDSVRNNWASDSRAWLNSTHSLHRRKRHYNIRTKIIIHGGGEAKCVCQNIFSNL